VNTPQKPNIIFIMTDQHRFDYLGCMGNALTHTPNLDALAAEGLLFNNAYCPSPVCGPARAAIFSGLYPGTNGHYANWVPYQPCVELLTDRLSRQGYYNAMVGKLHLCPAYSRHGFDWKMLCDSPHDVYCRDEVEINPYLRHVECEKFGGRRGALNDAAAESELLPIDDHRFWLGWQYIEDKYQMTTWVGDVATEFIEQWDCVRPLFLNISFFGPHHPYSTCEPWNSLVNPDDVELPSTFSIPKDSPIFTGSMSAKREKMAQWDESIWRQIIARYCGNIAAIDQQVGRIVTALKQQGLYDESLIVFTSDHGDHMGDFGLLGKGDMYDSSVKVPFIARCPGGGRAGQRRAEVVNTIDLFGTFLDAAGDNAWRDDFPFHSGSLLPLLHGDAKAYAHENRTFAVHAYNLNEFKTMTRRDELKLLRLHKGGETFYEAYDCTDDIPDVRNVYDDPAYAPRLEALRREVDDFSAREHKAHPLVGGYRPIRGCGSDSRRRTR